MLTHYNKQDTHALSFPLGQSNWLAQRPNLSTWNWAQRLLAAFILVCISPLFLLLYLAVKATSRGPFIFCQKRPGQFGKLITTYKIRTMKVGADTDIKRGRKVTKCDPMITPIGRILRDLKIDELPQLYNIVKGEMSFVGPRPIAPSLQAELEAQIPGFQRRLSVKPGLTSLGQVCLFDNGVSVIEDWSTRFEAELQYLYKRSVIYDLTIILLTILFLARKIIRRLPMKIITVSIVLIASLTLQACSDRMSTRPFTKADKAYEKDIRAYGSRTSPAVTEIQAISIPTDKNIEQENIYKIGAGDTLSVNVFGEAGMSNLYAKVDGLGYIQLPYVENLLVKNKTLADVQNELKTTYAKQFINPWVVVQIADYKSRPVYLLGAFNKPGVYYMDRPMDILQMLGVGQGVSDAAYLRGARVWRDEKIAAVDLHALLMEGRSAHNIPLLAGDTIFVPSQSDKKAYVLGAVLNAGAVPFANEPMTLMKALSHVGGVQRQSALISQVRIIRTHSAVEGQLLLVNAKDILKGKAPDLELMPDDIVYVPNTWVSNWNQVVSAITPSLQLVGGILQPVVQVKFLRKD